MLLHFIERPEPTVHHHDLSFLNCEDYVDVISFRKHSNVHFRGRWSQDWTLDPIQWSWFKYRRTKLPQSVKEKHEELPWWLTLTIGQELTNIPWLGVLITSTCEQFPFGSVGLCQLRGCCLSVLLYLSIQPYPVFIEWI